MPDLLPLATFTASIDQRNADLSGPRAAVGPARWVADGAAANIWKRSIGSTQAEAEFAVDLKLGSSAPPSLRSVGVGLNNTAAGNVARNRAIGVRDKVHN